MDRQWPLRMPPASSAQMASAAHMPAVLSATAVRTYVGSFPLPCTQARPDAAWIVSSWAGLLSYGPGPKPTGSHSSAFEPTSARLSAVRPILAAANGRMLCTMAS
jgi:hypothetical protein